MSMSSGNPVLSSAFRVGYGEHAMTLAGTVIKTLFLFGVLAATFGYAWTQTTAGYAQSFVPDVAGKVPDSIPLPTNVYGLTTFGVLVGFILAMVIIFNQQLAPYLSPFYAACEGLALGAISAGFEAKFPGIALEAVGGTLGTFVGMLALYMTGIIKPSQKLLMGLLAAMVGILALYIIDDIMILFFGSYVGIVHDNGWGGITLQVFIVGIAALNLIFDFEVIDEGIERGAPKYMEWYAAFGLMVTLVWLYLEILRLLAKTKSSSSSK